jgi:hypothetical protein
MKTDKTRKITKTIGKSLIALGVLAGTFFYHEKDLPPIYVRKVGKANHIIQYVVQDARQVLEQGEEK